MMLSDASPMLDEDRINFWKVCKFCPPAVSCPGNGGCGVWLNMRGALVCSSK